MVYPTMDCSKIHLYICLHYFIFTNWENIQNYICIMKSSQSYSVIGSLVRSNKLAWCLRREADGQAFEGSMSKHHMCWSQKDDTSWKRDIGHGRFIQIWKHIRAHTHTLMTQMGVFGVPTEMLKYTKLNWALRHCKNICRLKSSLRAPPCHPLQGGGEKDGNICSATNAYCMFYSRYSESHAPLNSSPSDETRSC